VQQQYFKEYYFGEKTVWCKPVLPRRTERDELTVDGEYDWDVLDDAELKPPSKIKDKEDEAWSEVGNTESHASRFC
jgi:hypothetical protein